MGSWYKSSLWEVTYNLILYKLLHKNFFWSIIIFLQQQTLGRYDKELICFKETITRQSNFWTVVKVSVSSVIPSNLKNC